MFNADNLKARLDKFRKKLSDLSVDAALIQKNENYLYLSGFTGTSAYLLITQSKAYLLTDFRYIEQATKQAPHFEVVKHKQNVNDTIKEIILSEGVKKLGFEDNNITFSVYKAYEASFFCVDLVGLGDTVEELRSIKDNEEIDIINKAVEIADEAFQHVLGILRPGITELDVAAELEFKMKKLGASGPSFDTIIASGTRSSMPHGVASEKKLELGDPITMDFGAKYNNYCSDMTRTVFLGQPDERILGIYKLVQKAQQMSTKGAIAGSVGKNVDKIARDIIYRNGYEENFGHGLGHGVGLEIHENPRLSINAENILQNNMAVTVEPGIYIKGFGGVRIEDIIIIKDACPIILTKSPKEIIVI
jgi:Xaa-Pro aminopeptidase